MRANSERRRFLPPGEFVTYLQRQGFASRRTPTQHPEMTTYWLDLTPLQLQASHLTPIVELRALSGEAHATIEGDAILPFIDQLKRLRLEPTDPEERKSYLVLILGGALYGVSHQLEEELRTNRIGVIDRKIIDAIYRAASREQMFSDLAQGLLRFLGLQLLSPYAFGKPVSGSQFFGRRQALDRILGAEGENFTIFGNRQIGKTSLMREIEHRLRLLNPNIRIARVHSSIFNRPEDFLETIVRQLDPRLEELRTRSILTTFADEVQSIPKRNRAPVVVFLDEFDRIIQFERFEDFQMLEILRAAFNHDDCRLFIAGFRRVRESALETGSPLHNFTRPEEVRALTQEETANMIEAPTRRLGIDVRSGDLSTAVFQETSGHPRLVQVFCTALIDHYQTHRQVPNTPEFLAKVLTSGTFRDATNRAFMANTSPFEKLLCYLLIGEALQSDEGVEDFEFGDDDIERLVQARGQELRGEEIDALVSHLLTGGVFATVPGAGGRRYEFLVPQMARDYRNANLEMRIRHAIREIEGAFDRESALFG
jgi:hypothetical protein